MNRGLFHEQSGGQDSHVDEMMSLTWAFLLGHYQGGLRPCWWIFLSILGIHIVRVAPPFFFALCGVANRGCCVSIQVPQRAEPQQEFRAEHGEIQGSWGAWGPWSTCSQSCGNGVQEQSRPCLPVYTTPQYPSRRAGVHPQHPGHVISALRPTVPLHRDTGRSFHNSSRGETRREKETRPGWRRYTAFRAELFLRVWGLSPKKSWDPYRALQCIL